MDAAPAFWQEGVILVPGDFSVVPWKTRVWGTGDIMIKLYHEEYSYTMDKMHTVYNDKLVIKTKGKIDKIMSYQKGPEWLEKIGKRLQFKAFLLLAWEKKEGGAAGGSREKERISGVGA